MCDILSKTFTGLVVKVIEQCSLFSQEDHGHFLEGITAQQTNLQHDLDWSEVAERVA